MECKIWQAIEVVIQLSEESCLSRESLIVPAPENRGEVPASIKGVLNKGSDIVFTFVRAWYYWMVAGNVSLEVARIMYENPIGAKDVRVAGHCGCPPPEEWARPASGQRFVDNYHIDSQEGLDLFVATMKEHGLID